MNSKEAILKFQNGKFNGASKAFFIILVFLAPIFFLPLTIFPVEINKMQIALFLATFSFLFYLVNAIFTKVIVYPRSVFSVIISSIFVTAAISSSFSDAKTISYFGNLYQPDGMIFFFVYFLVFIIASSVFGRKDFIFLGIAFFAGAILSLALGLLEMNDIFPLPFSFSKNAAFNAIGTVTNFGLYSAFVLIMATSILSEFKMAIVPKLIMATSSLLSLSALIIINNKLIWTVVSLFLVLIVARKFSESIDLDKFKNSEKIKSGKMEFPFAVMIASFFFFAIGPSLPALANLPIEIKPNISSTLDVLKYNFSAKNALIGTGPSTFSYNYASNRPTELNETEFWKIRFNEGYSFITTIISTMGVVQAILFTFLALYLARFTLKKSLSGGTFSISICVLFLLASLFFFNSFFVEMLAIFSGMGLIATLNSYHGAISMEKAQKNPSFAIFIIIIAGITGSLAILFAGSQKYAAAVYYEKALSSQDISGALKNIDMAIKLDPDSDLYLRSASQTFLIDANKEFIKKDKNSPDSLDARIQNDIALSVRIAQKATVLNPADSLNWANLGNIYEQIIFAADGADLFAQSNYEEAIKRDPKNFELEYSLARTLIASSDKMKKADPQSEEKPKNASESAWKEKLDMAEFHLDKSASLNKKYAPAYFQIAMIMIRRGETEKAASKLEEIKLIAPYDGALSYQLGLVYYNDGKFDKAKSELERAIALDENYSDARYVLGLIYDKEDKKSSALEQFERVLRLNPENESVKKIISNLKAGKTALEDLARQIPLETAPGDIKNPSEEKPKDELNIIPEKTDNDLAENAKNNEERKP